jgi:hypothetical protein
MNDVTTADVSVQWKYFGIDDGGGPEWTAEEGGDTVEPEDMDEQADDSPDSLGDTLDLEALGIAPALPPTGSGEV